MKVKTNTKKLNKEQRIKELHRLKVANGEIPSYEEEIDNLKSLSSALIGGDKVDNITAAKQLNRTLALFANTLPEETALEVSSVFPEWEVDKKYKADEYIIYGLNQDNEPQVYRVLQKHRSQKDWTPDITESLFKKLGFTEEGYPQWVQPMGAHDSYDKKDIVSHEGILYESTDKGNVWEPGVYGWIEYVPKENNSSKNKNK